jgi:UDP-glucose 4-epimerase
MGVLITGGMGYIGSRVAAKLPGSFIVDHKAGNDIDFYTHNMTFSAPKNTVPEQFLSIFLSLKYFLP